MRHHGAFEEYLELCLSVYLVYRGLFGHPNRRLFCLNDSQRTVGLPSDAARLPALAILMTVWIQIDNEAILYAVYVITAIRLVGKHPKCPGLLLGRWIPFRDCFHLVYIRDISSHAHPCSTPSIAESITIRIPLPTSLLWDNLLKYCGAVRVVFKTGHLSASCPIHVVRSLLY